MYRDIIITTSGGLNFTQTENNIVQDDVQGYRIVYKLSAPVEGYIKVTAKIPNQEPIFGIAPINGDTAYFIIPNSMYAIEGEVSLRVSIVTADERIITTKEITLKVIEANGDGNIAGDDRVPVLDTLISEVVDLKNQVTIALSEMTDVSGDIQLHMANEDNPHKTSYTNIQGENPSYLKSETDTLLDLKVDKATGKSLVDDTEISKLTDLPTSTELNTDLDLKFDKADYVDSQTIVSYRDFANYEHANLEFYLNKEVYKLKFNGVPGDIDFSTVYPNNLETDKLYRFEFILEIDNSVNGVPPSFNLNFLYMNYGDGGGLPDWGVNMHYEIPPDVPYIHSINYFVFQTTDGGHTWEANQYLCKEVI